MLNADQLVSVAAHQAFKILVLEEELQKQMVALKERDDQIKQLRESHEKLKKVCDAQVVATEQFEKWQDGLQASAPVELPEVTEGTTSLSLVLADRPD